MALFVQPDAPVSKLGVLRQLAKRASVHASGFQLGGMTIGEQTPWSAGMGYMDKDMSIKLLDAFWEQGGTLLIPPVTSTQDNTSEQVIGEWAEARGIRDQLIIATKYSSCTHVPAHSVARAAYTGNSAKNLRNTVEKSLKALRTTYIDILYVHWWDWDTSVEEVVDALHTYIQRGIVLYLGISDTPAWIVARANEYARRTGKTPFVIYQTMYNIMERSAERDILPFVRDEGMAFAPFGVLAGGRLRSNAEEERRRQTGENGRNMQWNNGWERSPEEKAVCDALEKVQAEVGAKSLTAVAIAYVMHKAQFVFPIVGGRKPEQMEANIEALEIALTPEQMEFLDNAKALDVGFPNSMIGDGSVYPNPMLWTSYLEKTPKALPIRATRL
ncbi:arylalcohol dehydrogenase [Coprinopsis marcescibilis]|uniref:Arylalcohol dehydrogenase n=1 Tax=Coprinopsis marcescibilis TaxID=230819 RepID=A0A5C3KTA8_COPMA|nr:arylalcohol dehydrogenase [Coprinopsis marcescibilis]